MKDLGGRGEEEEGAPEVAATQELVPAPEINAVASTGAISQVFGI